MFSPYVSVTPEADDIPDHPLQSFFAKTSSTDSGFLNISTGNGEGQANLRALIRSPPPMYTGFMANTDAHADDAPFMLKFYDGEEEQFESRSHQMDNQELVERSSGEAMVEAAEGSEAMEDSPFLQSVFSFSSPMFSAGDSSMMAE
tara:strand:- start:157 stop:594 length:438 start_codon:yes stop_codon:yes gene_type:complete